jgi:NAD(P)-dependent dehydrogenase (short-subunit alcohol dehydrogenase family)
LDLTFAYELAAHRERTSNPLHWARTPASRWGAIDDFGGIAVFLASAASDFVAGGYSIMA